MQPSCQPLRERTLIEGLKTRKQRADNQHSRDRETKRRAGEEVAVGEKPEQNSSKNRTCDTFEVCREPRERKRFGVIGLVRQHVWDHGLKGRRERCRRRIERGHQRINLPGFRNERQGERDAGAHKIKTDEQSLARQAGRERARNRRDADIAEHLDGERRTEDFTSLRSGEIVREQAERDSRQASAEERGCLRREEVAIGAVLERGEHGRILAGSDVG